MGFSIYELLVVKFGPYKGKIGRIDRFKENGMVWFMLVGRRPRTIKIRESWLARNTTGLEKVRARHSLYEEKK